MATISMFHLVIALLSCFVFQAQASGNNSSSANESSTASVTPSASTSVIAGTASTTSTPVSVTTSSAASTAAATTTVSPAASTSIQASTTASASSSVPTTQTTTKPTTAPKETFEAQVSAQMKLPKQWINSYSDLNSNESKTLINEITVSVKKVHNNTEVKINSISQGSVVVNFTIIFKNVVSGSDPVKSFQDAVKAGTFKVGNVTVDANSLVISVQYKGVTLIWKLDTDVYLKECCKSHIGKAKEKQECETNTTTCAAVPKETRELDCGKALNMKPPGCPSKAACGLTCFSTAIMLLGVLASKIIF